LPEITGDSSSPGGHAALALHGCGRSNAGFCSTGDHSA